MIIPSQIIPDLDFIWKKYLERKPSRLKLKTKVLSDKTIKYEEDLLGFRNYSLAIAKIIKSNASGKPFNIGIIAPWGHGKTTLMEFIREELEPGYDKKEQKDNAERFTTRFKDLLRWLSSNKKKSSGFRSLEDYHPTVWFNAWKYQSSDQIWAGVGHAIITQLVEKLEPNEQERFWFELKQSQIDKYALQRRIYRYINQKLPMAVVTFVLALACYMAAYFQKQVCI